MHIPYIIETTPDGKERTFDLGSRLLEDRIIVFDCEVTSQSASIVIQELLLLNNKDNKKPISLYLMTPGGECDAGLAIINTINAIEAPVYTFAMGCVASMGFAILSAGEKGHRYALPSARIMCHQSSGGVDGNIQDARANFKAWEQLNQHLADLIAKNCGMPVEEYLKAAERDNYMWPEEAKKFGVIDAIHYGAIGGPIVPDPSTRTVAAVAKKKQ